MTGKKVLIVSTSASELKGHPTGVWLEEVAAPYNAFKDAGLDVVLASIAGGKPPVDETSLQAMFMTEDCTRFNADATAQAALASTKPVSDFLQAAKAGEIAAVFLPGGHGTEVDFVDNADLKAVTEAVWSSGGVVSAVCHGPVGLVNLKDPATGHPLVQGKKVTGFSNAEEHMTAFVDKVPFMLETALKEKGGVYSIAADAWAPHVVVDGKLVTGQNPASSKGVALKIIEVLKA